MALGFLSFSRACGGTFIYAASLRSFNVAALKGRRAPYRPARRQPRLAPLLMDLDETSSGRVVHGRQNRAGPVEQRARHVDRAEGSG